MIDLLDPISVYSLFEWYENYKTITEHTWAKSKQLYFTFENQLKKERSKS